MMLLSFLVGCVAIILLLTCILLYLMFVKKPQPYLGTKLVDSSVNKSVGNTVHNYKSVTTQMSKGLMLGLLFIISSAAFALYFFTAAPSRLALFSYWQNEDKVAKVADDLLTGKIQNLPDWTLQNQLNSQYLLTALQANAHQHTTTDVESLYKEHHENDKEHQENKVNNEEDAMRWFRLANIYNQVGAPDSVLTAMARAHSMQPTNQNIAINYIQLDFNFNGQSLTANNRQQLQSFLEKYPTHQKAMMIMVMGETTAGNYEQALIWVSKLEDVIIRQAGKLNEQADFNDATKKAKDTEVNEALANLQQLRLLIMDKQHLSHN